MDGNSEKFQQAHPQETRSSTPQQRVDQRRPMAKPKESFRHKAAVLLAKVGLGATVLTGGAGAVHHVTGADLPSPLPPIAGAADTVESTAVDAFVKLANDEPKQEQANIDYEKAQTDKMFRPTDTRVGGQIEIEVSKLTDARTKEILMAIRMGYPYENMDPQKIDKVDNITVNEHSTIVVDAPLMADLRAAGLGYNYIADIDGVEVLIPEADVKVTIPGEIKHLSDIENPDNLDKARLLP